MIELENVHRTIRGQLVLRGVELRVKTGEILVVVGESGAGKSVLLKHVIGLEMPDRGDVRVDGESIPGASPERLQRLRRRMGYVFQDAALLDSLTIRENLRLALDDEKCECDPSYCPRRVEETLRTVNLEGSVLEKLPGALSGGMRKRVGVARAIVHAPEIILYDEPTTGLDPQNLAAINEVILQARERLGATSIVVTHDLLSIREVADRVALLHDGLIRFCGTPEELFASEDPVVRSFLGPHVDAVEVA